VELESLSVISPNQTIAASSQKELGEESALGEPSLAQLGLIVLNVGLRMLRGRDHAGSSSSGDLQRVSVK
jgi:hypothetical protein